MTEKVEPKIEFVDSLIKQYEYLVTHRCLEGLEYAMLEIEKLQNSIEYVIRFVSQQIKNGFQLCIFHLEGQRHTTASDIKTRIVKDSKEVQQIMSLITASGTY